MIGWVQKLHQRDRKRKRQEQRIQRKAQKLNVLDRLPEIKQQFFGAKKRRGKVQSVAFVREVQGG